MLNNSKNSYILISDVKRIEFLEFAKSKQVIAISKTASELFNYLDRFINVMYNRFAILEKSNCKNISEYNKNRPEAEKIQHFFILIDELADVITENKNIKNQLQKLLSLGRAAGIHCILATQAPNCKTIPTELKININARIALQVPNATNSKIIIDQPGAEKLTRPGDAILKINNISDRFRVAII